MTGKARLTSEHLEALRQIDSATISNAIETFAVRPLTSGFMGTDIRCMMPQLGVMVGHAVTVTADSQTEEAEFDPQVWWEILNAIEASPKPAVLVFQDVGPRPTHACHFGEGMATLTNRLGAVGLVTNGGVRDVTGARAIGFHFFAAGVVVSHGNLRLVSSGQPVEVSGVRIEQGDLIHADENGVVLIPTSIADQVAGAAHQVIAEEAEYFASIKGDSFTLEQIGLQLGVLDK